MYNQNVPPPPMQNKPDNYLVLAILTTVLCCLPFGIVAIVYSSKVDGLWNSGNHVAACDYSQKAKKWSIIAVIVGAVGIVLSFLFGLGSFMFSDALMAR